ncbi:MAG: hypothetical protein NZV14_00790 [Bryobacteraceae bacterium]|nr:hypothetical protein [Bryobacteraceae bacterium]MDW8376666.1 hypothetical protein [Bryobacterales bacterium]
MILFTVLFASLVAPAWADGGDRERQFRERVRAVIEHHARSDSGYAAVAARLALKRDAAWASRQLRQLLKEPTGDMFWMFPVTAIAYLDHGQLSPEARQALRESWRTYMPYRGDTENHWLLYYTCLYLMSQLYPNQPGETWYTGKSSAENQKEAEEWIRHWMDLTTTIGQGEYDCTHYLGVYALPLSYLYAWSNDPDLRERARKMLDWVIADYAVENLNGIYAGAHARTDDVQVLEKWRGVSSDLGWLWFGLGYPLPGYSAYGFFYAVASAYLPPELIHRIATDRSRPYLHREQKRTRHRWRFTDIRNAPVFKTTYVTKDYVVGSDQGGVLQPVQQHSWDVTWDVEDPRGVQNTIFSLHPYSSTYELQMYFTPMPDFLIESVVRSKKSYDSPDKFLGGSPYEEVTQELDTIIALYQIPPGTRFPHINGFFSKDLRDLREDASGWIFARGGRTYLAYRPLAPYEWRPLREGGKRLFSPYLKNGTIVQAAAQDEFRSFDEFCDKIRNLPLQVRLDPVPSVRFRTLRGKEMNVSYGAGRPVSNGRLFEGPFLNSLVGSKRLTLTHGGEQMVLDLR